MSAEIIPFPEPLSYLDHCHSPEERDDAKVIFELFAEDMPKIAAERVTCDLLKMSAKVGARLRGGLPAHVGTDYEAKPS